MLGVIITANPAEDAPEESAAHLFFQAFDFWVFLGFPDTTQVQLLSQAVEDVFSAPAVLLEALRAAPPDQAGGGQVSSQVSGGNRGGEASPSGHGLDLAYVNALYTAILKAGPASPFQPGLLQGQQQDGCTPLLGDEALQARKSIMHASFNGVVTAGQSASGAA